MTVKVRLELLPWPSVAVTVTSVAPMANVEPDAIVTVIVGVPVASVADGE